MRGFRALRGLRLLRGDGPLSTVVKSLLLGLSSVIDITCVLLFSLFVYTILGMQLFGDREFGMHYNVHANLSSFSDGFLFLLRVTLGQHFIPILDEVGVYMYLYVCSYQIIACFLILNLYVAVILESFDVMWTPSDTQNVTDAQIRDFSVIWQDRVREEPWFVELGESEQRLKQLRDEPLKRNRLGQLLEAVIPIFEVAADSVEFRIWKRLVLAHLELDDYLAFEYLGKEEDAGAGGEETEGGKEEEKEEQTVKEKSKQALDLARPEQDMKHDSVLLLLCQVYIGPTALTVQSRVEREAANEVFLADKIRWCLFANWAHKFKSRSKSKTYRLAARCARPFPRSLCFASPFSLLPWLPCRS